MNTFTTASAQEFVTAQLACWQANIAGRVSTAIREDHCLVILTPAGLDYSTACMVQICTVVRVVGRSVDNSSWTTIVGATTFSVISTLFHAGEVERVTQIPAGLGGLRSVEGTAQVIRMCVRSSDHA